MTAIESARAALDAGYQLGAGPTLELLEAAEEAQRRLEAVLAECDRADNRPGPDGERKVHTVVIRQAATI